MLSLSRLLLINKQLYFMKTATTFFLLIICQIATSQTKSVIITANSGLHSTITKIYGSNPTIAGYTQFAKTPIISTRIYKTGKKSNGLYIGLSTSGDALKVKNITPNVFGSFNQGLMQSGGSLTRFELGYHMLLKKIYFNKLLSESNKQNGGFFTQIQPFTGASFSIKDHSGTGQIGSYVLNGDYNVLTVKETPKRIAGVVYGLNFYFGKNTRTWFFINVLHNINLTYNSSNGIYTSSTNGVVTKNKVETTGSGFSFSGGLVLYKFKYRK